MTTVATEADALRIMVSGVELRSLRLVGTLPGLVPLAVAGLNGPGTGRLRSTGDGLTVQYRAPGSSTYGQAVTIAADGAYLLEDGENRSKWLRVQAYTSHMIGPSEAEVRLLDRWEIGPAGDDVTASEAAAGDVATWSATIQNDSTDTVYGITAWLDSSTSGLEISDDGVTWVNPTSQAAGLDLGDLAAAGTTPLYFRRTISAGAPPDSDILAQVRLAFFYPSKETQLWLLACSTKPSQTSSWPPS